MSNESTNESPLVSLHFDASRSVNVDANDPDEHDVDQLPGPASIDDADVTDHDVHDTDPLPLNHNGSRSNSDSVTTTSVRTPILTLTRDRVIWIAKTSVRDPRRKLRRVIRGGVNEVECLGVGFTAVYGGWKNWATLESQTQVINENRRIAAKTGAPFDPKDMKKRDHDAGVRLKWSAIVGAAVVMVVAVCTLIWGMYVLYGLGLGLAVMFESVGHVVNVKRGGAKNVENRPSTPLEAGVSVSKLQASVAEILANYKTPVKMTFHGQRWLKHGFEFDCHSEDLITDDHLRFLERKLQAGHNMVTLVRDRSNAAAPTLRLFHRDPLEGAVTPARREPKSLSCRDSFDLTRTDDGGRGSICFLGIHVLIVGRTGSGKSSGIWGILDKLVDCRDADVDGIDLTQGPALGAYRKMLRKVAFEEATAHEILDDALALIRERNTQLNEGIDADDDGLIDENWQVNSSPEERARIIAIDEYEVLAQDDDLRNKAEEILQTGRKARVSLIIGTPSSHKSVVKSTVPVNQSMVKIVFGVPFPEIKHVLGPGMGEEGWRPDRFEPQLNENPGDVGKCYVFSGEHGKPIVHRFDRLTPEEIRERNRARRQTLTTGYDRDQYRQSAHERMFATISAHPVLRLVVSAFERGKWPDRIHTDEILNADLENVPDRRTFYDEMKAYGLATSMIYRHGTSSRGYYWEDVEQAITKLQDR